MFVGCTNFSMKRSRELDATSDLNSNSPSDANSGDAKICKSEDAHTALKVESASMNLDLTLASDVEMPLSVPLTIKQGKNKLVLRNYQLELAEQALHGKNALIVAPTGSGKTAVLAEIIRQHINVTDQGTRRVLFFVPKTTLAQQQFKFLKRHLSCSISYIIGELTALAPPGQKMLNSQVTVLTPQLFVNELKRTCGKSYVSFEDISMMVFDECHNATKKHPYKDIMDMYLDMRDEKLLIQVVGVTASPGVGRAKDKDRVRENLVGLLANLNIALAPCIVEKNLTELEQHQNEIKESYIQVETETEFENKVMRVMNDIEECVKQLNIENEANQLNIIPRERSKQAYENWTERLKQHSKLYMTNQDSARKLITYARHLKMYHCLLELKNLVPCAMQHTNKMVDFVLVGSENIALEKKNQELQDLVSAIKLPMLDKLFKILKEEFEKNPDSRCIIFVKMRLTASSLEKCIANSQELTHLHPKYMTGTHASEKSEAMTKSTQESVLKSFKDGDTKVLIATSVAEEGLDIPACNLVIMYNYVTGEVGRIQRKGRGRASDSRAIVITSLGSDHLRHEEDNRICSQASDKAIEDVKKMPPTKLQKQISDIQERQKLKRKRERDVALTSRKSEESPSKWKVLCGDCGVFITSGEKLRHINHMHTVVKDEEFHVRMKKQIKEQKKGPGIHGRANFLCPNPKCSIKIALELVHGKSFYPTLSIKKIKLKRDDETIEIPGKKSNMPFVVSKSINETDDDDMDKSFENDEDSILEDTSLDQEESLELLELMEEDDLDLDE